MASLLVYALYQPHSDITHKVGAKELFSRISGDDTDIDLYSG